jgi:hypothetical protein
MAGTKSSAAGRAAVDGTNGITNAEEREVTRVTDDSNYPPSPAERPTKTGVIVIFLTRKLPKSLTRKYIFD